MPSNHLAIFQFNLREHEAFARLIVARFLFLLGTYAVGRFLLFFVAQRLELETNSAGEQTANILAILTLITVAAAPVAGWLADKINRHRLMIFGGLISAVGVILLMTAYTTGQILIFGLLLAIGSAAFSTANWALTADFAPPEEAARFLALANFGTVGAAAVAGLFGPLIDFGNQFASGMGYNLLFMTAAVVFLASSFVAQHIEVKQTLKHAVQPISD
jgi:MFS family permease